MVELIFLYSYLTTLCIIKLMNEKNMIFPQNSNPISDVPKPPKEPDPVVPKPYGFKDTHTETENHPKGLRTYASDMAEAVRVQEGSVIKIALAEQDKRARQEKLEVKSSHKNVFFAFASIAIILVGAGVFGYAVFFSKPKTVPTQINTLNQSIITNDGNVSYSITGKTKQQVGEEFYALAKNADVREGGVLHIIPYEEDIDINVKSSVDAHRYLGALGSTMSGSLLRSLSPEFMLGAVKSKEQGEPFIVLKPQSFDNAYAGMLSWEKKMIDDLFLAFDIPISGDNTYLLEKSFGDMVIKNQDARILTDNTGAILLVYMFVNNDDVILIARNEETLIALLGRLGALSGIR